MENQNNQAIPQQPDQGQQPDRRNLERADVEAENQPKGGEVPAPVPEPAERVIHCPLCTKSFTSRRALFGHLKSHPQRPYRGAFPPPTFSRAEFVNTGFQLNPEPKEEEDKVVVRQEIDLNVAQPEPEEERQFLLPDLNLLPPPAESDN